MKSLRILLLAFLLLTRGIPAASKAGVPFNPLDIHWTEIEFKFYGICVCPAPPPIFVTYGLIFSYWEPFLYIDTVKTANYSPFLGFYAGPPLLKMLGGKNQSSSSNEVANDATFAQSHAFMFSMLPAPCRSINFGGWWTELDPLWQSDELSAIITPEAALVANPVMQMACIADATATNFNHPLDFMPWCIGSGGSTYPMTGTVGDENYIQANNTVGGRMLAKLNRMLMICDPELTLCGCVRTPTWIKSHYKTHPVRPGHKSPAYPFGKASKFYDTGLNIPYYNALGPSDEFLWVVYRKQSCCTCCD